MGRPLKQGLEYYYQDVGWLKTLSIRRLGMKAGSNGLVVFQYLLSEVYKRGYYLQFDEYFVENMIFELMPIIRDSEDKVRECINTTLDVCYEVGLFSPSFRQLGILTSEEIQNTYFSTIRTFRRKKKITNLPYLLIREGDIQGAILRVSSEETKVIAEETKVIAEETKVNSVESARKERKGKEYNIYSNIVNTEETLGPTIQQVYLLFQHNNLSDEEADKFYDYYETMQWRRDDGNKVRWRNAAVNWIKNLKKDGSRIIRW